jgi:Fe2+ transport system protein FeoA
MEDLIPLYLLTAGQIAEIREVVGQVEQVRRLHEIGLRGGTHVEMLQPGKPCIVKLAGQTLCFRGDETMNVLVAPRAPT